MRPVTTYPAPPLATARRLEWAFLPPGIRRYVERRCGSPVVAAHSQGAGFTPGFASVLVCEDGSRHFVKAASTKAQRPFADAYREEARRLASLPEGVPAPRLSWLLDDDWVVLGIEHVEATNPARPWSPAHLAATLDMLERVAAAPGSSVASMELTPIEDELADWPTHWQALRSRQTSLPGWDRYRDEAASLAAGWTAGCRGESLVHLDVRADNVLLDGTGTAWLCDWNWPVLGASWIDSVMTLLGPLGDGLDVADVLATRPLLRAVRPDHLDAFLALLSGYFLRMGGESVPPSSPWIRAHQWWQGEVCWLWLAQRRGWA
ncbi:phosphotransferase [Nocardioides campestrisoli]|uniref:phosphotransferase n=1 Tax=Nocardioides campestrisoli TaxID=2736757 RepID=UPI0015E6DE00